MNAENQKKPLGIWSLTSLVSGTMIGSGIFLLPAQLAKLGTVSLWSWIITTLGALFLGIILAKVSILIPRNGGLYAYAKAGLGNFMGFQTAYTYWIAVWVSIIAVTLAMVSYLAAFFPVLSEPAPICITAIIIIWVLTFFNTLGAKPVGVLQIITTVLKIIPLLAIIIVGASHFDSSFINLQFHSDNYNYDYSLISSAAGITLWSFIGLETATIPYEHIENPRRNIPLATILGIVIASAIYIASTIVIMGIIPTNELANATISPFITVSQMLFGDYGKWILIIGAVISCFGCINGLIFAQGQLTKAAADDDLFPGIFAQRNKHNMPTLGLVVTAFIQTVIILSTLFYKNYVAEFDVIVLMASLATLIPYLYAASGSFIICKQSENQSKKGTYMLIAFLAALYSFWVITISDNEVILHGSFLVFIGVILYSLLYEGKINND